MYDGMIHSLVGRLEKTAQALYWSGYQDGLTHGALVMLLAWFVAYYLRSKT